MEVPSIDSLELKRRLEARHNVVLLDVREPEEIEIGALPGSIFIPLMQLERRLGELRGMVPPASDVIVCCRSGQRSAAAVQYLSQFGFESVFNLKGGLLDYSARIDPALTVY